jgi:hypothetical protein
MKECVDFAHVSLFQTSTSDSYPQQHKLCAKCMFAFKSTEQTVNQAYKQMANVAVGERRLILYMQENTKSLLFLHYVELGKVIRSCSGRKPMFFRRRNMSISRNVGRLDSSEFQHSAIRS